MDARLPSLSADELAAVGAGATIVGVLERVEEIKKQLFHQHESKRDIWKEFGPSAVR